MCYKEYEQKLREFFCGLMKGGAFTASADGLAYGALLFASRAGLITCDQLRALKSEFFDEEV